MPVLCEFDTQTVHPPANSRSDTHATVCFPRSFVAPPRLPHGFRALDVGKNANIRVKSTLPHFTNTWADCHIESWADTTLYQGIDAIFVLAPGDLDFLTGEHMRGSDGAASVRINFERPFVTPPRVVVFMNHIDLERNRNWRVHVGASAIDATGFTLHIDALAGTGLYAVKACWVAYPEDREHIFSTTVHTMDPGVVAQPQPQQRNKDVLFTGVEFREKPSVFVALNYLDVDCKANLRVKAYVDGVSRTGLVCHIDTWDDTVVYAAGVSIIAFG